MTYTGDIDIVFKIQDSILSIFNSQGSKFHNNLKTFRTYLNEVLVCYIQG